MTWGPRTARAALLFAPIVFFGCGAAHHPEASRQVVAAPVAAQEGTPGPGLLRTVSEAGTFVGFVRQSDVMMPPKRFFETVNAQTLWPVTDYDGKIVGYVAPDVPFVSLAVAQQPGFDIEKVRAARNGGCEDQIGDPAVKQEF